MRKIIRQCEADEKKCVGREKEINLLFKVKYAEYVRAKCGIVNTMIMRCVKRG